MATRQRRSTSGSRRRAKTLTLSSAASPRPPEVVTVGDDVELSNDLHGVVRFVGEIIQRSGIYYGIELSEERGKNNGTLRNICYFKCKAKRGIFLRRTRIQRVLHSKRNSHKGTVHRIGINQNMQIKLSPYKAIGNVRFIGTPSKSNGIYYGVELDKPVGDCNGMYNGTRYFTTDRKCGYFIKANSKRITYPVQSSSKPHIAPALKATASAYSAQKHNPKPKTQRLTSLRKYSMESSEKSSDDHDTDTDSDESSESKDDELRLMEYHKYYKNRSKQLYQNESVQRHWTDNDDIPPLKVLGNEWMIDAQNADTFKKRYDCTRSLMEKVRSNNSVPYHLNFGGDAINLLRLFADWLHVEGHLSVRKHIVQLLVPIGNTAYPSSVWKGAANSIAESLIMTQWFERKRGFVSLVTPALIAVYIGSGAKIKQWQQWLIKVIDGKHIGAQYEVWEFLVQLLEISVMRKSLRWICDDLMQLMDDATFMDTIKNELKRTKDDKVRLKCCLFVYGIAHCFTDKEEIQNEYNVLRDTDGFKLYFESIRQSKYSQLFKDESPSPPKAIVKKRQSYSGVKQAVAKMQRLEPSVSAPLIVNDNDESMVLVQEEELDMVQEEEVKEDELCPNCIDKKKKMDGMGVELSELCDELKRLNDAIEESKREEREKEEDKSVWILNVEHANKEYSSCEEKKKAMEQQLYDLRKTLYELKKLNEELDPSHLNEWTWRHILEWIIALDHGAYLKFENNIRRLLQEREIDGASLINGDLNETDLRNCGIHRFRDRKQLMKHIRNLVEQYKEKPQPQPLPQDLEVVIDVSVMSENSEMKEPGNVSVMSGSVLSEQLEGRIKGQEQEQEQEHEEDKKDVIQVDEESEQPGGKPLAPQEEEEEEEDKKEDKKESENECEEFECNECYRMKKENEGYDDENGMWYCLECWDEFNAIEREKEKEKRKKLKKKRKSLIQINGDKKDKDDGDGVHLVKIDEASAQSRDKRRMSL
eukprot:453367_1